MKRWSFVAVLTSLLLALLLVAGVQAEPITTGDGMNGGLPGLDQTLTDATGCVDSTSNWLGPGQDVKTSSGTHWAGVIYVHIPPNDPDKIPTYCTDLATEIRQGNCFVADGPTACPITWLLNNGYGPGDPATNAESAARQAAIWSFSDGLLVNSDDPVYARTQQIIAAVPNPCVLPTAPPVMTLAPASAVNFLPGGEEHPMTVTVTQDGAPVAGKVVNLSTTFGVLSHSSVTTGADGTASFTLTSNTTGSATVTASFSYTLPAGTRMVKLPGQPDQQVIVLGTPQQGDVIASASKVWEEGTKVIVHKFSDNNTNGVQDGGEESLAGWTIRLEKWDGTTWVLETTKNTGTAGNAIFGNLSPGTYRAVETLQSGWTNTTPNPSDQVTLAAGGQATIDFGNVALAVIKAWKFHDLNGNGVRDAGEPVLDDWQMNIDPAINGIGHGWTSGGSYSFIDLPPGDYDVWETLQPDWIATTPDKVTLTVAANDFVEVWFGNVQMDLGDLPQDMAGYPSYHTTLAVDGARHILDGRYLGAQVDPECDGCPCNCCNGDDDGDGNDDEDGVTFSATADWQGGAGEVVVTTGGVGDGCLNAWLDFTNDAGGGVGLTYRDGDFDDAYGGVSEWIIQNRPMAVGATDTIAFSVPSGFLGSETRTYYFRFRYTPRYAGGGCGGTEALRGSNALRAPDGASPTGLALGGEVEDYMLSFAPLAITLAAFDAQPHGNGVLVSWETVSEVSNAGFNLYGAEDAAGPPALLVYVPSQAPGSTQGAAYNYEDANLTAGETYWYWLEDVSLSGATTLHGPVSATVQAPTAVTFSGVSASPAAGSASALPWLLTTVAACAALALGRRAGAR